jgi:toxin FitB
VIVLDTNVLSELMRPTPSPAVLRWMSTLPASGLFTTSVTQAELLVGARLLPSGRRRSTLQQLMAAMFDEDFAGRVLAFDQAAVPLYVEIVVDRRATGRPISQFDAQIAAIARASGARLATRNVSDFDGCGVGVVNPWEEE